MKCSEINAYSSIISAQLKSPFCSSSSCQAYFPSIVRPMNILWEWILKIFFYSPEMNCSILVSRYLLRMTKKMDYFLRNCRRRERMFPGSISIQFLRFIGMVPDEESASSLLIGMQNLSHPVEMHVLRADLQELLCRCYSNPSQIYLIHENF